MFLILFTLAMGHYFITYSTCDGKRSCPATCRHPDVGYTAYGEKDWKEFNPHSGPLSCDAIMKDLISRSKHNGVPKDAAFGKCYVDDQGATPSATVMTCKYTKPAPENYASEAPGTTAAPFGTDAPSRVKLHLKWKLCSRCPHTRISWSNTGFFGSTPKIHEDDVVCSVAHCTQHNVGTFGCSINSPWGAEDGTSSCDEVLFQLKSYSWAGKPTDFEFDKCWTDASGRSQVVTCTPVYPQNARAVSNELEREVMELEREVIDELEREVINDELRARMRILRAERGSTFRGYDEARSLADEDQGYW